VRAQQIGNEAAGFIGGGTKRRKGAHYRSAPKDRELYLQLLSGWKIEVGRIEEELATAAKVQNLFVRHQLYGVSGAEAAVLESFLAHLELLSAFLGRGCTIPNAGRLSQAGAESFRSAQIRHLERALLTNTSTLFRPIRPATPSNRQSST
jgi:hypothetical protein